MKGRKETRKKRREEKREEKGKGKKSREERRRENNYLERGIERTYWCRKIFSVIWSIIRKPVDWFLLWGTLVSLPIGLQLDHPQTWKRSSCLSGFLLKIYKSKTHFHPHRSIFERDPVNPQKLNFLKQIKSAKRLSTYFQLISFLKLCIGWPTWHSQSFWKSNWCPFWYQFQFLVRKGIDESFGCISYFGKSVVSTMGHVDNGIFVKPFALLFFFANSINGAYHSSKLYLVTCPTYNLRSVISNTLLSTTK